ncbi:hypothetical protein COT94_01930 [Candidatus Falkowbacteria bacterium CG10_big_fil_rev_8_21_14_0_10_37_14]|uniref:Uncharacterized protein n=1 Tax=Candidatus Falkowbacteria bacterium CG10_big_fil_rev_8_21_14_0_10_37_14 TaxID=1974561 RepID=A0A2M6WT81_9BACT|nr:hypothetical protein [Candidatus Falkowbacteria bacterium]PIT96003.1 MAG: hypothetical protein COT94_01930 [Candidatus Falkowbacteria bacterium CG10_big_fil_rev_8_21_14_0_10_37_14]
MKLLKLIQKKSKYKTILLIVVFVSIVLLLTGFILWKELFSIMYRNEVEIGESVSGTTERCNKDAIFNSDGTVKLGYIYMEDGEGYYFFNKDVYYCRYNFGVGAPITCGCYLIENVDKETFEIIDQKNAKDKHGSYYKGKLSK